MHSSRGPWLVLIFIGLLVLPANAPAQRRGDGKLRRPYVAVAPEGDLEEILRANIGQMRSLENLKNLLDKMPVDADWGDLLKGLKDGNGGFDLNDLAKQKQALDLIEKIKQKNPEILDQAKKAGKIDDAQLNEIKKTVEDLQNKSGNNGGAKKNTTGSGANGKKASPDKPFNPADPETGRDAMKSFGDLLTRLADDSGVSDLLRDSPAIRNTINDIFTSLRNDEAGGDWDPGAFVDHFDKAGDLFQNGLTFFENVGDLPMPSWPNMDVPSIPGGGIPSFDAPALGGAPGVGDGSGLWQVFLWVGAIVAFGLILWQVLSRLKTGAAGRAGGRGWRLGPWPINPARVATRAEMIQAFEFLSLLLLGLPARTWNHHDLATGMGGAATGGSAETASAADRLASLYEEARYAPGADPLPGEALAEARRDLCFLAGVPAS